MAPISANVKNMVDLMSLAVNWRTSDVLDGLIEPTSLRKMTLFRHTAAIFLIIYRNYLVLSVFSTIFSSDSHNLHHADISFLFNLLRKIADGVTYQ